ncbi:hypothetical protein IWX84_002697 [Flavobacterium sp. CG_9.10]|uniref:hypothetical protein n=1 Tax=Flavobacterium sp. CG_9.10 TaxID=2787729 RepID=UPI0018CAF00E|nr:hypothetical protein [Flavobacterium sp. CG_9.10]MBG6111809.1 hypothetical protein [Flavobacterium sp. CG_9.10]
MEKNIYETIQDWHDLLKNGVITETEFIAKKNELLSKEKTFADVIEVAPETNKNEANFHSNYEKNQEEEENESFLSKYLLFIILGIICIVIFSFYYYTKNHKSAEVLPVKEAVEETSPSTNETASNNDKLYFDLVKEFLKKEWSKTDNPSGNPEIKAISFSVEDGKDDGDVFLSVETKTVDGSGSCEYIFSKSIKGDLDDDGIDEVLSTVQQEGDGTGGNFFGNVSFILKKNNSEGYDVNYLSLPENPENLSEPQSHMEYTFYSVDKIDNGFVYLSIGNPGHYYKDENGEDQLEEVIVKCKLTGNKLKVVN